VHLVLRAAAREGREQLGDDPAESVAATERRRHLLDEIRLLDRRDQEVLVCRYFMDLSEAETATTLDLPRGTVKSRTARALTRLRTRCGSRFVEEVPGA
jgi:RNA polymerase sigma factor (sigma-70 family)